MEGGRVGGSTEDLARPVAGSIPTIVRSFKSAVTKEARIGRFIDGASLWQRGYCERIIRDQRHLDAVRRYIILNADWWIGCGHDTAGP